MRNAVVIILAVIIHLSTFLNVGIGLYFHINKEFIAQQLCENRNKPEMHCNGKCYLTKQLHKAEKAQQNAGSQVVKEKEEIIAEQQELPQVKTGGLAKEVLPYSLCKFDLLKGTHTTQLRPPIS